MNDLPASRAGTLLLRIAPLIFGRDAIDDVVRPMIADLQHELREAGDSRRRRLTARCRGYWAFWSLAAIAPVAFLGWPSRRRPQRSFPDVIGRIATVLIVLTVLVTSSAGGWTLLPALGGSIFAVIIHAWHRRHPTRLPSRDTTRRPEINMSAIPVGGDVGGLLFVIGSIVVVVAGLPMLGWFLLGAVVTGTVVAWWLTRWHARHAPETHIVVR